MTARRWDDDERGEGVADASQFAEGASELIAAMRRPNWVAEEPGCTFCHTSDTPARCSRFASWTQTFPMTARTTCSSVGRGTSRVGAIRASIFSLLGSIAESSSYIRQRGTSTNDGPNGMLTFEVVTGMVDEMPFKPHGHTLRLSVATST